MQSPDVRLVTEAKLAAERSETGGQLSDLSDELAATKADLSARVDSASTVAQSAASSASSADTTAGQALTLARQNAARVLVGPGRPDTPATTGGVITGSEPVGTEYRSTDGANVGAFVWMKRPGGRWDVVDGDTGWRVLVRWDATGKVTSGNAGLIVGATPRTDSAGGLVIRRQGKQVEVRVSGFRTTSSSLYFECPSGMSASPSPVGQYPTTTALVGGTREEGTVLIGSPKVYVVVEAGLDAQASYGTTLVFSTDQTWPTTLPGTPA